MENKFRDKTLVKLENGTEIRADSMCWVLYSPSPRNYSYHSTLEDLLTELLNLRIKEIAGQDSRKNIQSLSESMYLAKKEITQIIGDLTTVTDPALSRLELQGMGVNTKNE